jgi:hypothetical protein
MERDVSLRTRTVRPHTLVTLILAAALLSFAGCGGSGIPVKGHATVNNKALSNGSVRFIPDKAKGNTGIVEPLGVITEDGTYELKTNGKPGAPPGWYKVVVNAGEPVDLSNPVPPPSKSLIAMKYGTPESTDISIEVKSGAADGAYDLKLAPPGADSAQPGGVPPMPK